MEEPVISDSVELARTAIRDLLAEDRTITVAELARRMNLGHQTLSHFVREGSEVIPRPHIWDKIKKWWDVQKEQETPSSHRATSKYPISNPTGRSVLECAAGAAGVSPSFGTFYAGVATGMAQAVHRSLLSAIREQEQLIEHLALLPAELDRQQRDEGEKGGKVRKEKAPVDRPAQPNTKPEVWLTPEEIDADAAVGEAVDEQKSKQKPGKRRNAANE